MDVPFQYNSQKTPTSAKVLCVCGQVIVVPIKEHRDVRCNQCDTVLWIEPVRYDQQNDILYIRPVAKVPKSFHGTILPNTPVLVQPEWSMG